MIDFNVPAGAKMLKRGTEDEFILCECGCGTQISKYGSRGRPRRFVRGHQIIMAGRCRDAECFRRVGLAKMGDANPMKRLEVRAKSSKSHKGSKWSAAQRESIGKALSSSSCKKAHSERTSELWKDPAYREKQDQSRNKKSKKMSETITKKWVDDAEYKNNRMRGAQRASSKMQCKWREADYVKKQMRSRGVRPNKLELDFIALSIEHGWGFKYVGDGELVIGGKCPDFHDGEKMLVEIYGDFWHRGQDPQDRIEFFSGHGYKCLVLWESEIRKNPEEVVSKVCDFLGGAV